MHFEICDTNQKLYIIFIDYKDNGVFVDRWSRSLDAPNPLVFMKVMLSETTPKTWRGWKEDEPHYRLMPITRKAVSVFMSMMRENASIISAPLADQLEKQSNPYKLSEPNPVITFMGPFQPIAETDTEIDLINKRTATYTGNLMYVHATDTMYHVDLQKGTQKVWDPEENN